MLIRIGIFINRALFKEITPIIIEEIDHQIYRNFRLYGPRTNTIIEPIPLPDSLERWQIWNLDYTGFTLSHENASTYGDTESLLRHISSSPVVPLGRSPSFLRNSDYTIPSWTTLTVDNSHASMLKKKNKRYNFQVDSQRQPTSSELTTPPRLETSIFLSTICSTISYLQGTPLCIRSWRSSVFSLLDNEEEVFEHQSTFNLILKLKLPAKVKP